jgi:hypothetical protein
LSSSDSPGRCLRRPRAEAPPGLPQCNSNRTSVPLTRRSGRSMNLVVGQNHACTTVDDDLHQSSEKPRVEPAGRGSRPARRGRVAPVVRRRQRTGGGALGDGADAGELVGRRAGLPREDGNRPCARPEARSRGELGHHQEMTSAAELSSLSSTLKELNDRVSSMAESAQASGSEDMARELFAVERSLAGALRRLGRFTQTA